MHKGEKTKLIQKMIFVQNNVFLCKAYHCNHLTTAEAKATEHEIFEKALAILIGICISTWSKLQFKQR